MSKISSLILKTFFLLFTIAIATQLSAQRGNRPQRAEGTAQVKMEAYMTRAEAEQKAVELAKVNAIENVFGTYIEQESRITVESGKSDFYIVGNTRVKGIWVRELGHREIKPVLGDDGQLWITCNIRGEVKRATPKPAIEYKAQNCLYPQCQTTSFFSGDQLYLWFRSPVNGFLSVFFEDDNQNIYRLLPYSNMAIINAYPIDADQSYLFFSPEEKRGLETGQSIDEIILETSKTREMNNLIVVFSTELFFKPGLETSVGRHLPPSTSKNRFENWLAEYRANSDDFIDVTIPLEIKSIY